MKLDLKRSEITWRIYYMDRNNLFNLIIYTIVSFLAAFFTIRLSYISGDIINKIIGGVILEGIGLYILAVMGLIFLYIVATTLKAYFKNYISSSNVGNLRNDLYSSIMNLDRKTYNKKGGSYFHNVAYTDMETLRKSYFLPKLSLIDNSILLIIACLGIFAIHPIFLLIALISTFIPYIIPKLYSKKLKERNKAVSEKSESFIGFAKEAILGLNVIRDFSLEDKKIDEFDQANSDKLEAENALTYTQNLLGASYIFTGFFMYAFVLGCGVILNIKGLINVGDIMVASQLTNNIRTPIIALIDNKMKLSSTKPIRDKVSQLLDKRIIEDNKDMPVFRQIKIRDLSFSYDGKTKILDGVNLDLDLGKKYLLVGESGSGKSTFLKILSKENSTYDGRIDLGGVDLKDIGSRGWNKVSSYLSQDVYIFERELSFNIALDENYDRDKLNRAIHKAGLDNFVEELEEGYDTIIKESATNISGGEKKRIGLGRIFYKDPSILLLDEPFSALDKQIAQNLDDMLVNLSDKTVLNISHTYDKRTIKSYDYVISFKDCGARLIEAKDFALGNEGGL